VSLKHQSIYLPKLVGAADVAESLSTSSKHVYELAKKGIIPHYRIQGSVRFKISEVTDWIELHKAA
jgi:excisionase family DNA binding protein